MMSKASKTRSGASKIRSKATPGIVTLHEMSYNDVLKQDKTPTGRSSIPADCIHNTKCNSWLQCPNLWQYRVLGWENRSSHNVWLLESLESGGFDGSVNLEPNWPHMRASIKYDITSRICAGTQFACSPVCILQNFATIFSHELDCF